MAKERFPGPGPFFKATLQTHTTDEIVRSCSVAMSSSAA